MELSSRAGANSFYATGWTYIRHVVDTAREPFLILDNDLRIIAANDAFYRMFLVTAEETEQELVYDLGNGQWDSPQLRKLLEDILPKSNFFKDFEVKHEFPMIGEKTMMVNARIMFGEGDTKPFIIMAMEDVSKQKLLEEKLKDYTKQLEMKVLERTKELEGRVHELEIVNTNIIERELRMIELKKKVEKTKDKISHPE